MWCMCFLRSTPVCAVSVNWEFSIWLGFEPHTQGLGVGVCPAPNRTSGSGAALPGTLNGMLIHLLPGPV